MIPFNDLSRKTNLHQNRLATLVNNVLSSGIFIFGEEVNKFEKKFSDYLNIKNCIAVGNGSDAISISLIALGIGPGDLVGTSANAGFYSAGSIISVGAKPYFIEVDIASHCITLEYVTLAIKAGVKAIIATHLYGIGIPDISLIAKLCKSHQVYLIEDCAQAHGCKIANQFAGTFGDLSTFSFYPTKNLGGIGDAGAIATNSSSLTRTVKLLRQYGWNSKYQVIIPDGKNSRMDEIQASVLSYFLDFLDESNQKRKDIANRYITEINNDNLHLPSSDLSNVYHLFVIKTKYREQLKKFLNSNGIACEIHYPILDYHQVILSQSNHIKLSNSETLNSQILSIPCFPELLYDEVSYIIQKLNDWDPIFHEE